jgi:uncharacterized protein with HEPN domain
VRGRSVRLFVADMLAAIDKMGRYTEGMDAASFSADEFTVDAVLRNLEVLGEAARNVPPEVRDAHPEIPWRRVVGLRNIVAHVYLGVDLENVWVIVSENVPAIRPAVEGLLAELDGVEQT